MLKRLASRLRSRRLWLWMLFLLALAGLALLHREIGQASDQWIAARQKRAAIGAAVLAGANQLLDVPVDFFPITGQTDPRLKTDGVHTIHLDIAGRTYPDWPVEVEVRQGRVWRIKTMPPPEGPQPVLARYFRTSEIVRQRSFVWAAGLWVTSMVLVPFARRPYRSRLAETALCAVILAAAAWAMSPGRRWEPFELAEPLPIAIGLGGFLCFLTFLFPGKHVDLNPGTCGKCKYDLTGNESGVCPECGTPTPKGLVDRWAEQAAVLQTVELPPEAAFEPAEETELESCVETTERLMSAEEPAISMQATV